MADDSSEKLPHIKVSTAYPGEWYIVEIEGGDGALSLELRRPVGEDDSDLFHLSLVSSLQHFDVRTSRPGGSPHAHEGVATAQLTFRGPRTVWPDFVRCIQALASVFDTLSTAPLDRQKVREHLFRKK
jgi:hypothetical protein